MKKYIFLYLASIIILAGCSKDFLDTEPLTQRVNTNFYQTEEDITQALNATYARLSLNYPYNVTNSSFLLSEIMSGERLPGGGPDDELVLAIGQFRKIQSDQYLGNWEWNYRGIFQANMILESHHQVKFSDEEKSKKALGEAYFLRAYYYFDLARMFGTVPLVLQSAPLNLPKANVDSLYAQIAADYKAAIENLPARPYAVSDIGRATKWAAQGMLARVFLFYTGVYNKEALPVAGGSPITKQQAAAYIDDAVSNSGHDLVPDYRNMWPYSYCKDYTYAKNNNLNFAGEEGGNKEVMFSCRYSNSGAWDNLNYSNEMVLFFGLRGQSHIPFGQGWGWGTVSPTIYDDWDDADLRKKASIINVNDPEEDLQSYTSGGDNQQQETGYYQKKYIPINVKNADGQKVMMSVAAYGTPSPGNYQYDNVQELVYLRFADVLLMGAELGSANAQAYLDRVRSRVGLSSVPATLDNIKKERRFELAFEGLRYYDLLRWHEAETQVNRLNNIAVKNMGRDARYSTKFRPETNGFLPIPESQITLSQRVITQNPGWE